MHPSAIIRALCEARSILDSSKTTNKELITLIDQKIKDYINKLRTNSGATS